MTSNTNSKGHPTTPGLPAERVVAIALLITATALVYGQTLGHDFVNLDDPVYITENPHVLSPGNMRWAFTTNHAGFWQPLTWISLMIDVEVYGPNPGGFHFTNLLLHLANVLLLLTLLTQMTGAFWRSTLAAALFAIHPLHVESVAWITERKDVLSLFFGLLAMLAYLRYARKPGLRRYCLVAALLALGLMAKPMLVTLPAVLVLLDVWPLRRFGRLVSPLSEASTDEPDKQPDPTRSAWFLVLEKVPLFAISMLFALLTVKGHVATQNLRSVEMIPITVRSLNAAASYGLYLRDAVWPTRLSVLYPHPGLVAADPVAELWSTAMISLAAVSVITALAVCTVRRTPYFLVGWLWYLGTLVPVIGMVQAGTQQRADRFTYLPMIGIYVSVVWLVACLVGNRRWAQVCASAASGIVLVALMIVTYHQVGYWQNSESLFRRAIAVTERNVIAHNNLGTALAESDRLDEAREQFQRAVDIAPDYADGHFNLARTLSATGKPEESLAHLHKAVELNPNFAAAHNSLGIAYVHVGRPDVAIKHFERAVEIDPELTPAVVNLEQVRRAVRDAR